MYLNDSTANETQFLANFLNNGKEKVIHGKTHKVLKEMTGNYFTELHTKGFSGLFPAWPIVEFDLAPSGAYKDTRMTQYVRCILALFEEILIVEW